MANILPIYYQIKQKLKKAIINGEYIQGDKIPSENQLAKQFSTTNLTVRRAISILVNEGMLVSEQGQGSFVTKHKLSIEPFKIKLTGSIDNTIYQIKQTKSIFVEKNRIKASNYVRKKLKLENNVDDVIQFKRVRTRNNKRIAYTIDFFPIEIGEKISKKEVLKKNLLTILEDDLKISLEKSLMTIEASFADKNIAKKLKIDPGAPLLLSEMIMYDSNNKPIEFMESSYPAEAYKYIVKLKK